MLTIDCDPSRQLVLSQFEAPTRRSLVKLTGENRPQHHRLAYRGSSATAARSPSSATTAARSAAPTVGSWFKPAVPVLRWPGRSSPAHDPRKPRESPRSRRHRASPAGPRARQQAHQTPPRGSGPPASPRSRRSAQERPLPKADQRGPDRRQHVGFGHRNPGSSSAAPRHRPGDRCSRRRNGRRQQGSAHNRLLKVLHQTPPHRRRYKPMMFCRFQPRRLIIPAKKLINCATSDSRTDWAACSAGGCGVTVA